MLAAHFASDADDGVAGLGAVATWAQKVAQGWSLNPGRYPSTLATDQDDGDVTERFEKGFTMFEAGVSRGVITPSIGSSMAGFSHRWTSKGVHDDLSAQALVLAGASGSIELVWICCDLLSVPGFIVDKIRTRVGAAWAIRPERVLVSAAHNHYASPVDDSGEALAVVVDERTSSYADHFVNVVVGLVGKAIRSSEPCRIRFGTGTTAIGVNRRERRDGEIVLGQNPDGPIDRALRVLRIDGMQGAPLAVVVHAACHVVSLGAEFDDFTADFPGVMRDTVQRMTGAETFFVQGCAGDVNPICMGAAWSNPARLGLMLAADVLGVYDDEHLQELDGVEIRAIRRDIDLAPWLPPSEAQAWDEIRSIESAAEKAGTGDGVDRFWDQWRLRKLSRAIGALRRPDEAVAVRCSLTGLSLGSELAIVTAPGEVFSELGLHVQARSPFPATIVAGYTNGSIDYIPTATAFREGGYEVSHGCRIAAGEGERVASELSRILEDLVRGEL
ncbi:MAG: hypothetical protein BGO26_00720 [Actinobacteria bacterium 69-20]|nr:MAG: hypothetical protein BGO26_00720 [Actinobacteria bacterium 69-20]